MRALLGSVKHINNATANGHKPQLYILTETWWEADDHPILNEYHLVAYILARRDFITGRAKGGIAVYKHQESLVPTRALQLLKPNINLLGLEIGATIDDVGLTAVLAYYWAPGNNSAATTQFFDDIVDELLILDKNAYKSYLVGDSNGDRDKQGRPRYKPNKPNIAAEAMIAAEKKANHTWLCPSNAGPCYTRYNITKKWLINHINFDPASATSSVDHVSAGMHSIRTNSVIHYSLHEELHLGSDHVGLLLELNIDQSSGEPMSRCNRGPRRKRLGKSGALTSSFQERSKVPL